MKRLICSLLIAYLIISVLPFCSAASENDRIYFDDGSYITIEISSFQTRAAGTVSGSKTYTFYDSDDTLAWNAVLRGTFSYTGSLATCSSATCDVTIYDSAWYTISKSAGKSGNTANASVTMGYKVLGITVNKVPINMSLSCDANGNLS